jgi:hypothetical protein
MLKNDPLRTPESQQKGQLVPLDGLEVEQLLQLRAEIDELLPARALGDLDLEHELVVQFLSIKSLQSTVLQDDQTAANQKAQVANAVASTLQQLVKMQSEHFNAERFKKIEALMVKALKLMPIETAEKFLAEYEVLAGE